ncbi:hypothetical protein [Faecalicatena contorta]|uniref:Dolichyl-phosphate-mannose-protein mannosyltransferase n=1 Tax=Faecalicatena contorta TaxID=39482 RepID=A0A315ZU46_9FIRM|nr:hypothetical protein [Faecalicatena contorta]PWJ48224.1 hypothetical protein A8805_11345 [Faecalicatena contorta]SUQ15500.1 hypothetical protein SAMN05216529_11345 [Faecalicatena contorta]
MLNNRFIRFIAKHRIFFMTMVMSIISVLIWILIGPRQDTGDDAFIAWELSRGLGSIAAFISPYFSLIQSTLYAYIPNIAWWTWTAIAGGGILMWIGFYMIQKYYKGFFIWLISVIWFIMTGTAIIYRINFTRTATSYALAGGMLIIIASNVKGSRSIKKTILYLAGIFLFLTGAMIRFQPALLIIPFMSIILFCQQGVENFKQIKSCFNKIWILSFMRKILPLISVVICTIFLYFVNEAYWNTHPEWKAYNTYNTTRSTIADYVDYYPTWDEAKDEYKALGLKSENDLDMLFGFVFVGDTEVFNLQTLKGISELKDQSIDVVRRIYRMLEKVVNILTKSKTLFWFILFLLILRYHIGKNRYLPICLCVIYTLAILFLFSFLGRMMLRVWEPTLLCCAGMLLLYFEPDMEKVSGYCIEVSGIKLKREMQTLFSIMVRDRIIIAAIVCLLAFKTGVFQMVSQVQLPNYSDDRDELMRSRAEYINDTSQRIYLLSWPLIHHPPYPGFFGIWEPLPAAYMDNAFALSNWDARTPGNLKSLNELGIENPVEALINRADTYSDYEQRMHQFLKEHYNKNITVSKVGSFEDGGDIVQYTSPVEENKIKDSSCDVEVDIDKSEYDMQNDVDAWYIKGKIDSDIKYEAIYCNIIFNDGTYTYRLNYDSDNIEAYFYGINDNKVESMTKCFLIGLTSEGSYCNLGTINL